MGLPYGMAVGRGNDEVGVIGRVEVDEFLPVRFVGIDRDEAAELLSGDFFVHAVNDQGANQGGSALEDGQNEIGDTGVGAVVGGDLFAPSLAQFPLF